MGHGLIYHILLYFSIGYLSVAALAFLVSIMAVLLDKKGRFFEDMDPEDTVWNFLMTLFVPLIMGLGWVFFLLPERTDESKR